MTDRQNKKENSIIKTYLGEWVTISYIEEGMQKSAQGVIEVFDDINFIRIKGDYAEKLISTANITSIKKKIGDVNE